MGIRLQKLILMYIIFIFQKIIKVLDKSSIRVKILSPVQYSYIVLTLDINLMKKNGRRKRSKYEVKKL